MTFHYSFGMETNIEMNDLELETCYLVVAAA